MRLSDTSHQRLMFDLNLNRKVIEHISRNLNTQLLNPLNFIFSLPGLKSWESNNTAEVLFIYFKQKKIETISSIYTTFVLLNWRIISIPVPTQALVLILELPCIVANAVGSRLKMTKNYH